MRITDLNTKSELNLNDYFVVNYDGIDYKISNAKLIEFIANNSNKTIKRNAVAGEDITLLKEGVYCLHVFNGSDSITGFPLYYNDFKENDYIYITVKENSESTEPNYIKQIYFQSQNYLPCNTYLKFGNNNWELFNSSVQPFYQNSNFDGRKNYKQYQFTKDNKLIEEIRLPNMQNQESDFVFQRITDISDAFKQYFHLRSSSMIHGNSNGLNSVISLGPIYQNKQPSEKYYNFTNIDVGFIFDTTQSTQVNFDKIFDKKPIVIITPIIEDINKHTPYVKSITVNGFQLHNPDSVTVNYFVIGKRKENIFENL